MGEIGPKKSEINIQETENRIRHFLWTLKVPVGENGVYSTLAGLSPENREIIMSSKFLTQAEKDHIRKELNELDWE